jgi:ABC-type glutathione transport system ATPase component
MLNRRITRETSGALAQAIALARLFVRPHAKLAILDEALNLMDQLKLRQIVMPKLFEFTRRHGICLIVITHNLSLLRELDHIFVMDSGKVVHSGTHKQLLQEKAKVYLQFMFPYHKQEQDLEALQREVDTLPAESLSTTSAGETTQIHRSRTTGDLDHHSPRNRLLHLSSGGLVSPQSNPTASRTTPSVDEKQQQTASATPIETVVAGKEETHLKPIEESDSASS